MKVNSGFYLQRAKDHLKVYESLSAHKLFELDEKRFLKGLFSELFFSSECLIKSILLYEMENNNLQLARILKEDMKVFFKVAKKYLSDKEINHLKKIIEMSYLKSEAELEFFRKRNLVFHSHGKYVIFTKENLINHFLLLKDISSRISNSFSSVDKYKY